MMRKSKVMVVSLLVIIAMLLSANVHGQNGYSVNDKVAKLNTELELTLDQSHEIALLLIEMDEKQLDDSERLADNPDAQRKAARKRMESLNEKMKKILNPDQFEKYQKMNLRSPSDRVTHQIDKLRKTCALTKKQVKTVQGIYEKYQPEMDQLISQMRSGGEDLDRREFRKKFIPITDKINAEIRAILVREQYRSFERYLREQNNRDRGQGEDGGLQGDH